MLEPEESPQLPQLVTLFFFPRYPKIERIDMSEATQTYFTVGSGSEDTDKGFDIVAAFHNAYGSVEDFEAKHGVEVPEDIAALLRGD